MPEMISTLLQLLLTALGAVSAPEAGMLGLAVAVLAVAVLALATSHALPAEDRGSPHPLRAIDVSTLLAQSDPSAEGHARPRAPGRASAA